MKNLFFYGLITLMLVGCDQSKEKTEDNEHKSAFTNYITDKKDIAKKSIKIDPKIDIVDLTICTAASMKIGQGIGVYQVWTEELINRYRKTYPNKSESELDNYVSERIDEKLRYLKSKGLDSQISFAKFYDLNCKN